MKTCTKCGLAKPLDDFGPAPRMSDGRHSWCRACRAAAEAARRDQQGADGRERRVTQQRAARRANPERAVWQDMQRRCSDPSRKDFKHYGGRGIYVANEWLGDAGFLLFLAHVGRRPSPRHSIDRIDNDKGYIPGNVRWATHSEQLRHFSRTRSITAQGRTQPLAAWAQELGVAPRLITQRIDMLGWSEERAVTERPRRA